jgi:CDP-diacylglycerol--glycerol-3-phosphate 3-phosphatidyltransferase
MEPCGFMMQLTLANQITFLRIVLIIPFVLCMLEASDPKIGSKARYIAVGIFVIMAVSDAVDGYVARVQKKVTRLGTFLDPMADKLLMTCACILLATAKTAVPGFRMPLEPVVLILGKDVLVSLGFMTVYLLTGHPRVVPVWAGKLATFLQLVMVASTLIAPEMSRLIPYWKMWVKMSWWLAGIMAAVAVVIYIYHGMRYIDQIERQNRQNSTSKTGKQ